VTDWINSHAGLIVMILAALFLVTLAFQRTKGGPV
jgi:hypothetical protein